MYNSNAINRPTLILLIAYCLLLPNIHISGLASQTVVPREFFLYLYSVVFVLFLAQLKEHRVNAFFLLALCFLVWQFVALGWSSDHPAGIESVLNSYVFLLSAYVFFQIRNHRVKVILLNTLIVSMSMAGLIGILQNFGWNTPLIFQAAPPSSTFVNTNLAASASLLVLPATVIQLTLSDKHRHKILFSAASTLLISFILVAHTKGVWLAGASICLITLIIYLRSHDKGLVLKRVVENRFYYLSVALLSLTIFSAPGIHNVDDFTIDQYTLSSGSAQIRLGFYRDTLPLIKENPIAGIGSGSLRRDFRAEPGGDYKQQHAEDHRYLTRLHNDHLQYLLEQGIVGLALWLIMLLVLAASSTRHLQRSTATTEERFIQFSLLMGITGMLIHGLFSFPLRTVSTGSLFWLVLGLALSYQEEERCHSLPASKKNLLAAAMLILSVVAIHNITNRAIFVYSTKQASAMLTEGKCLSAMMYMDNALDVSSLDIQSAHLLSFTYDYCAGVSPEKTITMMDRVLAYEPNQALALLVKSDVLYEQGDLDTAFDLYLHARLVNPTEQRAYLGMASIEAARGNRESAIKLLKQLLQIDSDNQEAITLLNSYTAQ
jgi:O-antigen ligase